MKSHVESVDKSRVLVIHWILSSVGGAVRPCRTPYRICDARKQATGWMVSLDEHVRFAGFHRLQDAMPPTLYVDDDTVLREVHDITALQQGDHCIVGLNVLHGFTSWTDALCCFISSWEVHGTTAITTHSSNASAFTSLPICSNLPPGVCN